jgi:hypothetical protein
MAGRELTVTVVLVMVTPWVGTDARETACVAGRFEMLTAENVTACDAGKFPMVTVPMTVVTDGAWIEIEGIVTTFTLTTFATVTELATALVSTALVRVTTVGVSEIAR